MVSSTPESFSIASKAQGLFDLSVKAATPDIVLESTVISQEEQALNFENLTSRELINIVRTDVVGGRANTYSPIRNIKSLALRYGPKIMIPLDGSSDTYFRNFPIKLEQKIPDQGTGPNGSVVYIDPDTKDLIVNIMNLADDERVEVQVMRRGDVLDDTIYGEGNI